MTGPKNFMLSARSTYCSALGIAVFAAATAHAGPLAVGPVEQVLPKSTSIVVLGQTFHLAKSQIVGTLGALPASTALSSIRPGTVVAVDGTETAAGKATVEKVVTLPELNVPGATRLLVAGVVSAVTNTGRIRIGNLTIDINATLTDDRAAPAVGEFVEVIGTQPTAGGLFLADAALRTNGIVGTGASANGIVGTGASSNGIVGTGASSNGIVGTGASSNGIVGTGASANGIVGTGASSNGIVGTGASSNGIVGTGASANGIVGTGASSNGIVGTGASSNGIVGTGQ
jgi:hypothetical protein